MSIIFSFFAGILSTLSPCVLPILPIIVASSLQQSWRGLVALVTGLALMFAVTGTVITYAAVAWGFDLGGLLALVWTPCVGPIMGSAMSLAIQGDSLLYSFFIMLGFGIGAASPLLAIGLLGQRFTRNRNKVATAAHRAKVVMCLVLLTLGVLVLTRLDKQLEIALMSVMPEWLIDVTTLL